MDIRHNALDNIDVLSQLPRLEYLMVGYNNISAFEGTFPKIRVLALNHNPVTPIWHSHTNSDSHQSEH